MTPADLVRDYGLKPDDLVVHAGSGGLELLCGLRKYGCRVLLIDPDAVAWQDDIDTLRVTLTPSVERTMRQRYGPVALLLVDGGVVEVGGRPVALASRAA